jgi:glutamate synthase (NADPH/NADH) large chain
MAALGFRKFEEMIGQTEVLDKDRAIQHWKAKGLDFSKMFHKPRMPKSVAIFNCEAQDHGLDKVLDNKLIGLCKPALESKKPVKAELAIRNIDRSTGAMLSGEVAKRYGHAGLPEDTIWITLNGTAGQSFGAWAARGVTLDLVGEGNDYVGKGLSGGKLIVRPNAISSIKPEESIIVGNTVLYGAIAGECYFRGIAGERFAVRNSGAVAVVEGTGDHGCEYMTGGAVVVLGPTGRNFAAGMSGGIAYVLDETGDFETRLNKEMVGLEAIAADPGSLAALAKQNGNVAVALETVMADMSTKDAERLHALIVRHAHYTNSARAQAILANWAVWLPKFKKIMPHEYKRALANLAKTKGAGAELEARNGGLKAAKA